MRNINAFLVLLVCVTAITSVWADDQNSCSSKADCLPYFSHCTCSYRCAAATELPLPLCAKECPAVTDIPTCICREGKCVEMPSNSSLRVSMERKVFEPGEEVLAHIFLFTDSMAGIGEYEYPSISGSIVYPDGEIMIVAVGKVSCVENACPDPNIPAYMDCSKGATCEYRAATKIPYDAEPSENYTLRFYALYGEHKIAKINFSVVEPRTEETGTDLPAPVTDVPELNDSAIPGDSAPVCDGCMNENDCVGIGGISQGRYCTPEKTMMPQKIDGNACGSSYECTSGICMDKVCAGINADKPKANLISRFLSWLRGLF